MHWTRILELILEFGLLGFLAWRLWSLEGWVCDIPAWLNEIEDRLKNHAQRLNVIQDRRWEEPARRRLVFAVDFDGTIVEAKYPDIGRLIPEAAQFCRAVREKGHILILNTCRTGTDLVQALAFCAEHGLQFDYVNENAVELIDRFGDCRKIAADYYIDDKNLGKWTWKDAMKLLEAN